MATAIITPQEVERLVPAVVAQANQIVVKDAEQYEFACSFLTLVANRKKQVADVFDPIVKKAYDTHKEAVAQKKKFMEPLEQAEISVKSKVTVWRQEEDRKRRQEELRLAEEARKKQEEEALAEAAQLEASGDKELADLVLENAAQAPAPVVSVPTSVPKFDGVASRTNWKWRKKGSELDAIKTLVKAAAADDRLLGFLQFNETAIGSVVRSQKSLTNIPGVEAYSENSVSVRG